MSRYRWWLLLILVFVAVLGTVLWWPVSPMWTQDIKPGRIVGYVHDGKSVLVWEGANQSSDLAIYDVETGRLIQRKSMEFEKDWRGYGLQLLPDGKHFFYGEQYLDPATYKVEDDYSGSVVRPRRYRVLDVDTHQVVAGPFIYSNSNGMTFSPDGRWFWSYNPSTGYGQDVIETMTGKTIYSARASLDRRPIHVGVFAPDGSAIAVHWYHDKSKKAEIEIIDLPEAKTRFTYTLPPDIRFHWTMLGQWKNDRIYMEAWQTWRASKAYKTLYMSFPILPDKLGEFREEPQLEGYFDHRNGPYQIERRYVEHGNRLVQASQGKLDDTPDWLSESLAWIEKKVGGSPLIHSRSPRLSFFDNKTGQLLYSFGSPYLRQWEINISPDGRRVASTYPVKGLMMWDADPFPRWPWAGGLGLLAVGLLLCIRYLWKRRTALVKVSS